VCKNFGAKKKKKKVDGMSVLRRGAIIVFEGCDRCGKSFGRACPCGSCVTAYLQDTGGPLSEAAQRAAAAGRAGLSVVGCSDLARPQVTTTHAAQVRFPDRTTAIGRVIDSYLKKEAEMDDHAAHLLFSANRWELM
jgi:hypothetical protein